MKPLVSEGHGGWNSKLNVFAFLVIVFLVVSIYGALEPAGSSQELVVFSKENHAPTRALLTSTTDDYDGDGNGDGDANAGSDGGNDGSDGSMNRIGVGSACSKDNILVFQGPTSPLPNGTPTFTVQIQNVCFSDSCSISNIHLNCGWFSSARLINPKIFRRVGYDDCLVNNGEPLNPGEALSFQYANIFKYPLAVASVAC